MANKDPRPHGGSAVGLRSRPNNPVVPFFQLTEYCFFLYVYSLSEEYIADIAQSSDLLCAITNRNVFTVWTERLEVYVSFMTQVRCSTGVCMM